MKHRLVGLYVALGLSLAMVHPLLAQAAPSTTQPSPQSEQEQFLRFRGDGIKGGYLETSDTTYKNDAGVSVRLVAVVHIAEPAYYDDIQQSFVGCDAVLYEMVKPHDMGVPQKGAPSDNPVHRLQVFMKDTLGLSFQLDEIDYSKPNFIHADMDAETFQQMESQRGESLASLMLKQIMQSMSDPGAMKSFDDEPTDLMDFMTRPDGDRQLKLLLGRRLGDIENEAAGINMLNGTVILTERNKTVMKHFDSAVKDGKKDLAVFFGAAHMPDLSKQLESRGYKQVKRSWRPAWDATIRTGKPSMFQKLWDRAGQNLLDSLQHE
jgi:hypothetical protein